jgi:hypothetical protein
MTFKGSHYVYLVLSAIALAIPWVLTEVAGGQIALAPAIVSALANVLTIVKTIQGLLGPSVSDKVNVQAGQKAEAKELKAGAR